MRPNRAVALAVAAALLAGCATADDYRDACRAEHPDSAGVEDCANQRADSANTTAVVATVVGVIVIGAIAAAAASSSSSSKNDYDWLRCFPLGCPPQTPR
jgi:1,4-dihydroxy-2-naphthoate octaprenyltransferase